MTNGPDLGLHGRPWVCLKPDHRLLGPFTFNEVEARLHSGELDFGDAVWTHGWPRWQRLRDTSEFNPRPAGGREAASAPARVFALEPQVTGEPVDLTKPWLTCAH